jgi:propionyl-CoA carboxylase alpha chain
MPVTKVLVANRGETARRVFATCRALGIGCVAVHSDADADAPFVAEADAAVRLPGSAPADTYLRADLLVEAALRSGADAVHPGYGFLSENAGFAAAVEAAGLVWVGPPPAAIEAMGSKTAAKKAMAAAGVPVLDDLDPGTLTGADLPVLVKASAGGGGRGMRVVRDLAGLPAALAAATAEAESAFGDGTVFVEPYVERGRHVEVQVMADRHGTVRALGERECSIQRRHQKVLEESPSPLVEAAPGLRERLEQAAVTAATAIGYVGAGTVEFLVDAPDGLATTPDRVRFFFLETNTRLQVEHPVTELRQGIDLVAMQLAVAAGHRLPTSGTGPRGHAIEVRLYAEDPADGWAPQTGPVHRFDVPGVDARFSLTPRDVLPVLRLDAGVEAGSTVGPHYDAMLAKLVCWAPDRATAAARLAAALAATRLHGIRTNRDLLVNLLRDRTFLAGEADTTLLETEPTEPTGPSGLRRALAEPEAIRLSALAAALAAAERRRRDSRLPGVAAGWRNVSSGLHRAGFIGLGADLAFEVRYAVDRDGLRAEGYDGVSLVTAAPEEVALEVGRVRRRFEVTAYPGLVCVDSPLGPVQLVPLDRFPDARSAAAAGSLVAPMPGVVTRLGAAVGDRVTAGTPVLWLEAMKMEHALAAPVDGVVTVLAARVGAQVEVGAVLAVVEPEAGAPAAGEEQS